MTRPARGSTFDLELSAISRCVITSHNKYTYYRIFEVEYVSIFEVSGSLVDAGAEIYVMHR